jgi:hypothetical protein
MTKESAKDYLPLVQALADGKTIQLNVGSAACPKWMDEWSDFAFIDPPSNYRIKPEPRRIYGLLDKNGNLAYCTLKPRQPSDIPDAITEVEFIEVVK